MTLPQGDNTVLFEWPYTGVAQLSFTIRAPEFGDTQSSGRSQFQQQTRAGYWISYDRGRSLDERRVWRFENVTESERANFKTFLDNVAWGNSKLKVTDWNGTERIVRITTPSLQQQNARILTLDGGKEEVLWNFQLELLDITDNLDELTVEDQEAVSSAFGIHTSDQIDAHNPRTITTVDAGDGAVIVDSVNISTTRSVVWFLQASNGTKNAIAIAYGSTDRNYDTPADATAVKDATDFEWQESGTEVSSEVTLSQTVSGSGDSQVLNLTADTTTDGWTFTVRRVRI